MTVANGNGADSRSKAYATLLTKRSYLPGALVLHQSLVDQGSAYPLVVFATRELPQDAREILARRGIRVREIEYLQPPADKQADFDEHDLRFQDTWTKLRVFEMAEYEVSWPVRVRRRGSARIASLTPAHGKVVLSPCSVSSSSTVTCSVRGIWTSCSRCRSRTDGSQPPMLAPATRKSILTTRQTGPSEQVVTLSHFRGRRADAPLIGVIRVPENCGHTQARFTTPLAAADFSRPTHDRLNSGLVVLRPSQSTFDGIVSFLHNDERVPTYKFPDQDLLADYFKDRFLPISYRYNALKTLRYCHAPMWRDEDVKNVHYIMKKPWDCQLREGDPDFETHSWYANRLRSSSFRP